MRNTLILIGLGLLILDAAFGQARRRPGNPPPTEGRGVVMVTLAYQPSSLEELVKDSEVIVVGKVDSATGRTRSSPITIETDSMISVAQVLKGPPLETISRLVVSQRGGTLGNLTMTPAHTQIMSEGERYVLFLAADTRPGIPAIAGVSRFFIRGVWSGKFKVEQGRIKTRLDAPPSIRAFENARLDDFVEAIRAALRE